MPLDAVPAKPLVGGQNPAKYLPYHDHVRSDVVILRDNGLMAMVCLEGYPYHLASNSARNGAFLQHFALLQLLADPETEISEHYVSHRHVAPFIGGDGGTPYAQALDARYQSKALGKLRKREWFITVVVRPRSTASGLVEAAARRLRKRPPVLDPTALRELEGKMQTLMEALAPLGARRLGTYRHRGLAYSQISEALLFLRTLQPSRVPLSHPPGSFGKSLYTDFVGHGRRGFFIEQAGGWEGVRYGRMMGLRVYPHEVAVGMCDPLMTADADMVLTNNIRPIDRAAATDKVELFLARLKHAGDKAADDVDELIEAMGELTRGKEVHGRHNWALAVHADDPEELDAAAARVLSLVKDSGCLPAPFGILGSEAAYWSQWPGNQRFTTRPATIGLSRFAMLSSLDGFPSSSGQGHHWGAPAIRFRTAGDTAFDFGLHEGQVGHTLFVGPVRSGKTLMEGALVTAATSLIGQDGRAILLDKDFSNALAIRANGGSYTVFERGLPCASPLRKLTGSEEDVVFASGFIVALITADGGHNPGQELRERLIKGLRFVLRLPPEQRTISTVHAFLQQEDTRSAERLLPWCAGHERGWAFDADSDPIDFQSSRLIGVDLTSLLKDDAVLPPMVLYLTHMASKVMDGRRVIFIAEEAKFTLEKPYLAALFVDIALTGPKKNTSLWVVTQQPEHLLRHADGASLLGQLHTRLLFRNPTASREAYCGGGRFGDGLHCTSQEYEQVRSGMSVGARSFLMQRPHSFSMVCRYDLSVMPEDIAILSGTPKSVRLWDRIAAELGTRDPETIRPVFLSRIEEARA